MISSEPLPTVMLSLGISRRALNAVLSEYAAPSGYRCRSPRADRIASTAIGEGPREFSFEPSLMTSLRPNSRLVSSIGLPGEYGTRRFTAGRGASELLGIRPSFQGSRHPPEGRLFILCICLLY